MKNTLKFIAAAMAAVTAMSCAAVTASADRLETRYGVTYRYTDTGRYLGRFTGWTKSRGKTYYYLDGVKVTKNTVINGRRFKFDKNGVYLGKYTGWATTESGVKHYWKNGEMLKNCWVKMKNGKVRRLGSDGSMRTGWSLVTRSGRGRFSWFDKNGYWDGKTYNSADVNGMALADVLSDIDFFSGDEYFCEVYSADEDVPDEFFGSELLYDIIRKDLNTPLVWDGTGGGIGDVIDRRGMARIAVSSSASDTLVFEIADGGVGYAAYLYCPYYGFGLELSDKYAFSELAREIGLNEWDYTQTDGGEEDYIEYADLGTLDTETERVIVTDFLHNRVLGKIWNGARLDKTRVFKYYGTYKNGEVVVVWNDELERTDDIIEIEIAGYEIQLSSGSFEILLHRRDGSFMPIDEAYDFDLLTDDDIAAIAYYSRTSRQVYKPR